MPPPPNISAEIKYAPTSARAWAAGWDYATARCAVDEHLRGRFMASYQLAIDLNRHPAVIAARRQRRSAITALPWILRGPDRAPQRYETEAAVRIWEQIRGMLGELEDDLAVMGFAVIEHPLEIVETERGPRYEVTEVRQWPLACVEHGSALLARDGAGPYDPDRYYAKSAVPDPVTGRFYHLLPRPGETDGHFTVIAERVNAPHRRGAIIACDLEYVAAQLARRGWAKLQVALGKASPVGEMPGDIPIQNEDGSPNDIAAAFQEMLEHLGEEQIAGIRPAGSKIDMIQVAANTADLLPQSVDASCRMFALALLGHDGAVSHDDVYNDPQAQSVPQDLARDDERVIMQSVSGLLTFVGRLNCESCAPITISGQIPDSDQDMRRENVQKRREADDKHALARLAAGKACADQLAAERAAGGRVDAERAAYVYGLAGLEAPRLKPPAEPLQPPHGVPSPVGAPPASLSPPAAA